MSKRPRPSGTSKPSGEGTPTGAVSTEKPKVEDPPTVVKSVGVKPEGSKPRQPPAGTLANPTGDTRARSTTSTGRATSPKPKKSSVGGPLPFGLGNLRYALEVIIAVVDSAGEFQKLPSHLRSAPAVEDFLKNEVPEIYETILLDDMTAVIFFGRRYRNEGLTLEDAEEVATALSHGYKVWLGRQIQLKANVMVLGDARRAVGQAMTRARDKERRSRRERINADAAARAAASEKRRREQAPAWSEGGYTSEEDDLLGAGPEELATSRLEELDNSRVATPASPSRIRGRGRPPADSVVHPRPPGQAPARTRKTKRATTPRTSTPKRRTRRQPSPALSPSPTRYTGTSEVGDSDASDASVVSRVSRASRSSRNSRSSRASRHNQVPLTDNQKANSRATKLTLPQLDPDCGPEEYLMWRSVVTRHVRLGYRDSVIAVAAMSAVVKIRGVLGLRTQTTVAGILAKLDQKYKIGGDVDSRMKEVYNIQQYEREDINDFASRVSDLIEVTAEFFPSQWSDQQANEMCRDRFFFGLRQEIRGPLAFMQEKVKTLTFEQTVDMVRSHETTHGKKGHRRQEISYHRNPKYGDRSDGKNNYGAKTQPRGRMAGVGAGGDEPATSSDTDASGDEFNFHLDRTLEAVSALGIGDVTVRIAKGVAGFERSERLCYACDSPDHLYAQCPERGTARDPLRRLALNKRGGSRKQGARPPKDQKANQGSQAPRVAAKHPAEKSS